MHVGSQANDVCYIEQITRYFSIKYAAKKRLDAKSKPLKNESGTHARTKNTAQQHPTARNYRASSIPVQARFPWPINTWYFEVNSTRHTKARDPGMSCPPPPGTRKAYVPHTPPPKASIMHTAQRAQAAKAPPDSSRQGRRR